MVFPMHSTCEPWSNLCVLLPAQRHGFPKHLFLVNSVRANRGKALVFVDGCLPFLPGIVKNVFLVSSVCANRRGLAQKNVFVNSVSLNVRGFGAFALFFCAFAFFQSRGMAF